MNYKEVIVRKTRNKGNIVVLVWFGGGGTVAKPHTDAQMQNIYYN